MSLIRDDFPTPQLPETPIEIGLRWRSQLFWKWSRRMWKNLKNRGMFRCLTTLQNCLRKLVSLSHYSFRIESRIFLSLHHGLEAKRTVQLLKK